MWPVPFSETGGQRKSCSAQMFSEWHSGQNGGSNSTCCLRLMNVLRKTSNPTLKIRRGKSYLLDFPKSVIHAFPLKSCYAFVMSLLVPVAPLFEASWQPIYLHMHKAPCLFSRQGLGCGLRTAHVVASTSSIAGRSPVAHQCASPSWSINTHC